MPTPLQIVPVEAQDGPGNYSRTDELYGFSNRRGKAEIKNEAPWHRQALWLFANRATKREVAELCGVSIDAVVNLFRQPWFQKKLTEKLDEQGQDILEVFKAEALNSLETLIEIRDDPEASRSVRLSSALAILDRAPNVGKPTLRIEHSKLPTSADPVAEVARLQREIKEQQKTLGYENSRS